jgi:hypothetical protein
MVAEAAGEVIAVISLSNGAVIADPFKRTAEAVRLLGVHRVQLSASDQAVEVVGDPVAAV